MAKRKIQEWVVRGIVTFGGAECIVEAADAEEAMRKANALENLDGIDTRMAEVYDTNFNTAEPNV